MFPPAGTVTLLVVPLSLGVWATLVQLAVPKVALCSNPKPVEGEGQEIITFAPEGVMVSTGITAFTK